MANAATWKCRVAQWRASGQTAAEFADGRDFAVSTLTWWASRLNRTEPAPGPPVSMIRVATAAEPAVRTCSGVAVEVDGARVVLEVGFDRETLARVLEVLGGRP